MKDKTIRLGQVIKGVGGNYNVLSDGEVIVCNGRGKLRLDGDIFIGDYVEFSVFANGKGAIEKILPRYDSYMYSPKSSSRFLSR